MKSKKTLGLGILTILVASTLVGCNNSQETNPASSQTESKGTVSDKVKDVAAKEVFYQNPTVSTPDESLTLLKEGNIRYLEDKLKNYDLGKDKRTELTKGQKPHAVIITCSDSRVAPEHLFDQGLGDIFVIRVAGNILDKAELGSIEYAVDHLGSPLVMVLGHEDCGAVTTAVNKALNPNESHTTENIDALLDNIEPSVAKAQEFKLEGKELVEKASDLNVEYAVKQALTESEIVKEGVEKGKVKVVGAKYMISTGEVKIFE